MSHRCACCSGEFASIQSFDRHFLDFRPKGKGPKREWEPGDGPRCKGEAQGSPFVDPAYVTLKARMRRLTEAQTAAKARRAG